MMFQRFLFGLIVLMVPGMVYCQTQQLTLPDALDIALEHNLTVSNVRLHQTSVSKNVDALRTKRYPVLSVSGGTSKNLESQNYTFEKGVWGNYPTVGDIPSKDITIESANDFTGMAMLSAVLPLSQQYSIDLNIKQGTVKYDIAGEQLRLAKQDIARAVKQQYFGIIQAHNDLDVTMESILFYKSLQKLVTNYVAQQTAFKYELLEVNSKLAQRQLNAQSERNRLATRKEQLNNLLGRDINMDFNVTKLPTLQGVSTDVDEAIARALKLRPDIRMSKLNIKDAKLGYDIKKADYIPIIDLSMGYSRFYNYDLIPDTESYVGLRVKWEFFDWGRKKNLLASENSKIRQADNKAIETKNKAEIDVKKCLRQLNESEQSVVVAELSRAAAKDKLQVLMNQYKQQAILLQKVLDAETGFKRANNKYSSAILSVWESQAKLEKALGEI
ncbi:MAG: TolC family protein [Desulfobacteraceae bacterium]|nr:TolC family protein [Desulfobacteraceae bacterium]